MRIITLNHHKYQVHDRLFEFNVSIIPSKGISFFGSNPNSGSMFFQFANGGTYIYNGITPEVRKGLWSAQSVGGYVAKNIVKKFPSEKLQGMGVTPLNNHTA